MRSASTEHGFYFVPPGRKLALKTDGRTIGCMPPAYRTDLRGAAGFAVPVPRSLRRR